MRAGEMAQQLGLHTALTEELKPTPRGSQPLYLQVKGEWKPLASVGTCANVDTDHTHRHKTLWVKVPGQNRVQSLEPTWRKKFS